jgi:3-methylfumaryl-CoA hydratase
LCFVTIEHLLSAGGSKVLLKERQDIVYRGWDAGGPNRSERPQAASRYVKALVPSSALLFRYSALTFNAHRIHYDHRYATSVEGYSGLVVHGPLQARS